MTLNIFSTSRLPSDQPALALDDPPMTPERRRAIAFLSDRVAMAKRSKSGRHVEFGAHLTPEMAADLLRRNPQNRRINQSQLMKIERDLRAGNWDDNGEEIVISPEMTLVTGQHRCQAVVNTGVTMLTDIKFGVDMKHRATMDQGSPKTTSDCLEMGGETNARSKAAISNIALQYINHRFVVGASQKLVNRSQQLEFVATHRVMLDVCVHYRGSLIGSPAIIRAAAFLIANACGDIDAMDTFIKRLIDGDGLGRGNPAYHAREQFLNKSERLSPNAKMWILLSAWNDHRGGKTRRRAFQPDNHTLPEIEH